MILTALTFINIWPVTTEQPTQLLESHKMGCDMRKPVFRVCEQQRRRPAEVLLEAKFLGSLCSWAGWFGYDLVWNPEDKFYRVKAQMM